MSGNYVCSLSLGLRVGRFRPGWAPWCGWSGDEDGPSGLGRYVNEVPFGEGAYRGTFPDSSVRGERVLTWSWGKDDLVGTGLVLLLSRGQGAV